jgi:coenzyme F420-reducing hydrogenase delta subunit
VERVKTLLEEIGMEPERVKMYAVSAAMAGQFVEAAKEMTEKIKEIGPNPLRKIERED